jgi:uracil-DNA glycosylase
MGTIDNRILNWISHLVPPEVKTKEVEILNPLENPDTLSIISEFYKKFYGDSKQRIALFGINPGRLGAGLTGIGFTDPVNLERACGISNSLPPKQELSSKFIYDMIDRYGDCSSFFNHVYIGSVVPFGFVKNGVNLNYYDIKELQEELTPYIKQEIKRQLDFVRSDVAFCIGKGKNQKFLEKINSQEKFFDHLEILPHPRWIMQYKLKHKLEFIDQYVESIKKYSIS